MQPVTYQDTGLVYLPKLGIAPLEILLLSPDSITNNIVERAQSIHHTAWGPNLTEAEFLLQVEKGMVVGALLEGDLVGILRVNALRISHNISLQDPDRIAKVAQVLSDTLDKGLHLPGGYVRGFSAFLKMGHLGSANPDNEYNILGLGDLTTDTRHEGKGIAGAIISYALAVFHEHHGLTRPPILSGIDYAFTLSPASRAKKIYTAWDFHVKYGAVGTDVFLDNARPEHPNLPDIRFACYVAPGVIVQERYPIQRKVIPTNKP